MALVSKNPIVVDGIEYPFYALNLAVSPLVKETSIGGSVSMKLTPYRYDEDGKIDLLEQSRSQLYLDVFTSGDAIGIECATDVMTAIQKFIDNKNW
jgi:hypothetical protein